MLTHIGSDYKNYQTRNFESQDVFRRHTDQLVLQPYDKHCLNSEPGFITKPVFHSPITVLGINTENELQGLTRTLSHDPRDLYPFKQATPSHQGISPCSRDDNIQTHHTRISQPLSREQSTFRMEHMPWVRQSTHMIQSNEVMGLNTRMVERDSYRGPVRPPNSQTRGVAAPLNTLLPLV
jgi:hypothetical protein